MHEIGRDGVRYMKEDIYVKEDLEQIAECGLPFEAMYHSTVLVTGATGLVGSLAVKALLMMNEKKDAGIRILAMARSEEKVRQLFDGVECGKLRFLYGDLTKEISIEESVDYIIHTASPTGSKFFVTHPVETIEIAVGGTRQMLELAKEKQVKGMVYLSSMEVYGVVDPELPCVTEKDLGYIDILNVRSCYSEGKRICECLCASYASEYQVPVRIARLAQTFGAGVPATESRVFAQFAKSAIRGEDIVLHTEGKSVGNYCYTADVVKALFLLLVKGESGQAYTVTNETSNTTIRGMAEMVAKELAAGKIKVVFDIPEDTLKYGYAPDVKMQLDAGKLRKLGWEPQTGLLESYRRMIGSWKSKKIAL